MKKLLIGGGHEVLLDDDVWEAVHDEKWGFNGRRVFIWVRRDDGILTTISLARLIMGVTDRCRVFTKNGNRLDLRRDNLSVVAPKQSSQTVKTTAKYAIDFPPVEDKKQHFPVQLTEQPFAVSTSLVLCEEQRLLEHRKTANDGEVIPIKKHLIGALKSRLRKRGIRLNVFQDKGRWFAFFNRRGPAGGGVKSHERSE